MTKLKTFTLLSTMLFSLKLFAVPIHWVDWISETSSTSAEGQINVNGNIIDVDYTNTNDHLFVQTGTGTNYWTGNAYTNGNVDNAPTASELIALNQGGTVTLTFSSAIQDFYLGLVSWNGNTVDFGTAISVDSQGRGYWGVGTAAVNSSGTGFTGNGEVHGVIQVLGDFTSVTFTHLTENWHGFTVGVAAQADSVSVPSPSTLLLPFLGLAFMIAARKQNK